MYHLLGENNKSNTAKFAIYHYLSTTLGRTGGVRRYGDHVLQPHRRAHPSLSDGQDGVIEDHSSHLYVYTIFMLDFVHHGSAFQRTEILDGAQYVEDKLLKFYIKTSKHHIYNYKFSFPMFLLLKRSSERNLMA